MKKGKTLKSFTKVKPTKQYVVTWEEYERYGPGEMGVFFGTGEEVLEKLKEDWGYDDFIEDWEDNFNTTLPESLEKRLKAFLKNCDDRNGDGDDWVQVIEVPEK